MSIGVNELDQDIYVITLADDVVYVTTNPNNYGQPSIQFQDEGANVGEVGVVNKIDFVGSNVSLSLVGGKLTVTISGTSSAAWGSITGTITNQSDLTTLLAAKQSLVNSATALVDAATMDLTAIKHTLASSSATRTFTISYTGDDIVLIVTLSATGAVYTFPATALCVSDGVASGDNTLTIAGVSGDKYAIAIKKVGTAYYVACKNFGQ
jgi:hypothetical protein